MKAITTRKLNEMFQNSIAIELSLYASDALLRRHCRNIMRRGLAPIQYLFHYGNYFHFLQKRFYWSKIKGKSEIREKIVFCTVKCKTEERCINIAIQNNTRIINIQCPSSVEYFFF